MCPGRGSLFTAANKALAVVQIMKQDNLPAAGSQEDTDTPSDTGCFREVRDFSTRH